MTWQVRSFVGLALLLQSVYSQSQQCYFCNTEVHGQGCNDPIDPLSIQIQRCSDSEIVTDVTSTKNFQVSVRNYADVCIYMTYTFSSRNVSARGCEAEYIDTNIGVLDICEYYRQIVPTARISNFNCSVCTGSLCNHANYVPEDQIESEEPEVPEEPEQPEDVPEAPEQPEDVPEEEVGDSDTDSANVALLSAKLLVALIVGKIIFV